jgi:hypothetical protein
LTEIGHLHIASGSKESPNLARSVVPKTHMCPNDSRVSAVCGGDGGALVVGSLGAGADPMGRRNKNDAADAILADKYRPWPVS